MRLVGVALAVGVQSVSSLGQFLGALAILGAAACGALSSFVVLLGESLTISAIIGLARPVFAAV